MLRRLLIIIAHRFNWHYMPPHQIEGGAVVYWCQWCGLRVVHEPSNTASSPTAPGAPAGDEPGNNQRGGLCPGR